MLLEINFTLVLFAVSFLIFIYLLNLTLYKPVGEVIEKRKNIVEGDLNKAKELTNEANQSLDDYTNKIKKARFEAQNIVQETVKQSEKTRNERISGLVTSLTKEKDDAISKIKEEEKVTMGKLEGEIKSLTDLIVNQVLGKEKDLVSSR